MANGRLRLARRGRRRAHRLLGERLVRRPGDLQPGERTTGDEEAPPRYGIEAEPAREGDADQVRAFHLATGATRRLALDAEILAVRGGRAILARATEDGTVQDTLLWDLASGEVRPIALEAPEGLGADDFARALLGERFLTDSYGSDERVVAVVGPAR